MAEVIFFLTATKLVLGIIAAWIVIRKNWR